MRTWNSCKCNCLLVKSETGWSALGMCIGVWAGVVWEPEVHQRYNYALLVRGLEGGRNVSGAQSDATAEDGATATPEAPDPATAGARPKEREGEQFKGQLC